jgi:hypothetical protein
VVFIKHIIRYHDRQYELSTYIASCNTTSSLNKRLSTLPGVGANLDPSGPAATVLLNPIAIILRKYDGQRDYRRMGESWFPQPERFIFTFLKFSDVRARVGLRRSNFGKMNGKVLV